MSGTGLNRTVLGLRVRQRRLTLEELTEQFEVFAREHRDVGTLSHRHVQRLAAGEFTPDQLRPGTVRLLERFFECPVEELLASPAAPASELLGVSRKVEASAAIVELRNVLTDYGFNVSRLGSTGTDDQPPTLRDLKRDLKVTFDAYQQSRFTVAAGRVSTLLADVQLVMREQHAEERGEVSGILALSYQAAASVLIKAGESDLAWIAAERGLIAAASANSPVIRGSLIRSVAFSLLSTGRLEAAMRLIESGGSFMEAEGVDGSSTLSVYGTLFLAGAMAAARFGDSGRTVDYLTEAAGAARRLGKDANDLWTAFGPTNVAIHRVNTAAELGDMQKVLDSTVSLNIATLPVERKVRYLFDVARAYSLTGKRKDALGVLIEAERMAPEQVRQHHVAKKVVMTLVQKSPGKPSVELGKLAQRVNVAAAD
jgi:hypothetical protein